MALVNFINLKDDKKNSILNAIELCLKNHDFDELGINDIAAAADISRGSFYNYFKDKNDAVTTMIDSKILYYVDMYKDEITKNNGDIFNASIEMYNDAKEILNDVDCSIIINNLKYLVSLSVNNLKSKGFEERLDNFLNWLIKNTKQGAKKFNTKKKMCNLLDIIVLLSLHSISQYIAIKNGNSVLYDDFEFKIEIIRNSSN